MTYEASAFRYHTAGAIEDIKKETVRDRDSSIQKRLSWNYGQHIPNNGLQLKNKHVNKCLSSDSMRSSSGVSSTSTVSLHLSIGSELDNPQQHNGNGATTDADGGVSLQVRQQQQQQQQQRIPRSPAGSGAKAPPPVPPRNFVNSASTSHVSTTYITQDDVVVSSSPKLALKKGSTPVPTSPGQVPTVQVGGQLLH